MKIFHCRRNNYSPEEWDEVHNSLLETVGRRARKGPKQHRFLFSLLPITTVNEHWALLPASARDDYPVSSRGTGITVLAYQLESLAFPSCMELRLLLCSEVGWEDASPRKRLTL
jgi:hypothetical protein